MRGQDLEDVALEHKHDDTASSGASAQPDPHRQRRRISVSQVQHAHVSPRMYICGHLPFMNNIMGHNNEMWPLFAPASMARLTSPDQPFILQSRPPALGSDRRHIHVDAALCRMAVCNRTLSFGSSICTS